MARGLVRKRKGKGMDLSIVVPARNEEFIVETIDNILENIEGETEIIVVLDGYWPSQPINDHPRVTILHYTESIGQRAATNQAVRLSNAKYIMKIDAHCTVDKGFDVKMMADMQDDWTMIPTMYNLHAFDWVCDKCNVKEYQGVSHPCPKCGDEMRKDIVFKNKTNPTSTAFMFDNTLHFQYWGAYKKQQKGDLVETMSIQGSCFMLTREKYWELDICDEKHGSWGQQGVEVACKTWLSGGRVICNKKTWYAHMFRTQGGDFGFPYPNPGISKARAYSRDLWLNNKWDKAIHPFSWLIEKFNPPGWDISKGIIYYTDNQLDEGISDVCQKQLSRAADQNKIVCVSLKKMHFGTSQIVLPLERGYLTMAKQILAGLEALDTDIVFFCEHDVMYHKAHFDFIPSDKDTFYYNDNVWFLRLKDGHALHYDANQLSGLCAYREPLIKHYKERIALIEKEGFSRKMGFEPMTHNRIDWKNKYKMKSWKSKYPNVDIKHDGNLTGARWKKEEFRNKKFTKGWTESTIEKIDGWNNLKSLIDDRNKRKPR